MSQTRYINYGDLATADGIKTIVNTLCDAGGVFIGGNFSVSSNAVMQISPFQVIEYDGVVITETEIQYLTIPNQPAAVDYTVVYQHTDANTIGGVPATLTLVNGLQTVSSITNGLVMGWVRYPGGSVPLSGNMFYPIRKIQLTNGVTNYDQPAILPPVDQKMLLISNGGPAMNVATSYLPSSYTSTTTWTNPNATNTSLYTYLIPVRIGDYPFGRIVSKVFSPSGCIVSLSLVDANGTILTPSSNNAFTNDSTYLTRTSIISPAPGQMIAGTIAHLQIVLSVGASLTAGISGLWLSQNTLPY